jgi:prepilin-type N-terminal cleavage/methylation domain-containing protein
MKKGFTLVELLVVMAIIGTLTAVAIGSTTLSRAKARDTRRIGDMKEIQIGLALYYDVNKIYPAALSTLTAVGQGYLPSIPTDPQIGYSYEYLTTFPYKTYCLGVRLESTIPPDSASCTSAVGTSTANYKASR